MSLKFETGIYPKLCLIAEAATTYSRTNSAAILNEVLSPFIDESAPNFRGDSVESISFSFAKDKYRYQPIRTKIREFVLQAPSVLTNSYAKYQQGVKHFQSNITTFRWKELNPLVQRQLRTCNV